MEIPKKGDLVYIDFDPQSGYEQAGHRPGIILSPERFNRVTNIAVVCPITSKIKGYPFEVKLPEGLPIFGAVLTDQQKSLDWKSRGLKIIGQAPENTVKKCVNHIHKFIYE
ncbi:mRNA interferase MazF [Virgibacillus natechei]|uniref:mRNA interferase MazF n=1 Tax=Virgibacillus natechei TaxID=1216297 RepID=A0ABS4IHE2_9BACI|nr:type II toxin-antitoxin system PemK/MazF family toxin [Virgibacillus natechei]MBP1970369.1 mRNA interferase MazF [Virgibacillus natechei]UZD13193.1 type II toxin-antitoxin system PemK/MazF family toxin [Virgibacillus natechei]